MQLENKCAVVTGSVTGLGYAIAERLSQEGANVVLTGLETEKVASNVSAQLQNKYGRPVMFHRADLKHVNQIEDLMAAASKRFDGIDIVVNNAVVRHFSSAENLLAAQWDESLAINLSAAFHTIRLAIPHMRKRRWGRVLNMSSVYGSGATVNRVGYVTTKTALIGMTRAIALETADSGITCNAVCPGTVPTQAIMSRIADLAHQRGVSEGQATHDYLATRQPTGRFVSMENVAAMIAFLCSKAGDDITGSVLPIDGGWTAR